jgi:hypothetical protein
LAKKERDFFFGIQVGDLVHVENGPRLYKGKNALVIARDVLEDPSEELIKEPEPNITVLCHGDKVSLWPGWVKKLSENFN